MSVSSVTSGFFLFVCPFVAPHFFELRCAIVLSRPGFVCLTVTSHFFESSYAICVVEGYLRGRHPLRISCTLKMGTMKARIEVRSDTTVPVRIYVRT